MFPDCTVPLPDCMVGLHMCVCVHVVHVYFQAAHASATTSTLTLAQHPVVLQLLLHHKDPADTHLLLRLHLALDLAVHTVVPNLHCYPPAFRLPPCTDLGRQSLPCQMSAAAAHSTAVHSALDLDFPSAHLAPPAGLQRL